MAAAVCMIALLSLLASKLDMIYCYCLFITLLVAVDCKCDYTHRNSTKISLPFVPIQNVFFVTFLYIKSDKIIIDVNVILKAHRNGLMLADHCIINRLILLHIPIDVRSLQFPSCSAYIILASKYACTDIFIG